MNDYVIVGFCSINQKFKSVTSWLHNTVLLLQILGPRFLTYQFDNFYIQRNMGLLLLKGVLTLFILINQVLSDFSPQLQEAIDFCGGLSTLTDGLCPPQDPADESALKRQFLPAKNIKVCKSKWVQIMLERTYKPHYHYQNFSPLANGTDLDREKYAILQTNWH